MASDEQKVVKVMAEEIVRAIRSTVEKNNKEYVNYQVANASGGGSGSGSGGGGGVMPGTINASQVRGLYNTVAGYIINAASSASGGDEIAGRIISTLNGIAEIQVQSATIHTAQIENLYASYGEFINLVAEHAQIQGLDVEEIYAELAEIGLANIHEANIGWAQVKDLVTGTAIIREGTGGHLFIDRLAVSDANMVSLTAGEIMLKDSDGNFVRLVVDGDTGAVTSEVVTFDGDDVFNDGSLSGGKLIENTITARELNVSSIFADTALIRAIKAANIDVADLFADQGYVSRLYTSTIQSPNAGRDIDISGNSQITLLNDKIGLVVEDGSTASEVTLTPGMISAVSDVIDVKADTIDLSANTSIDLKVRNIVEDETYYRLDIFSTGDYLSDTVTSTVLSVKLYKGNTDVTTASSASNFIWKRFSGDTAGDNAWNNSHTGAKSITITSSDVQRSATFQCEYTVDGSVLATVSKGIVDMFDGYILQAYLGSNLPTTQVFDVNTSVYAPDWSSSELVVTPTVMLDQIAIENTDSKLSVTYKRKIGSGAEESLISGESVSGNVLHVNVNVLGNIQSGQVTYIAYVTYTHADGVAVTAKGDISFTLVKSGANASIQDVSIQGGQAFRYTAGATIADPTSIVLTAITTNVTVNGWYFKASSGVWTVYPGSTQLQNMNELTVRYNDSVFIDNVAIIKVTTNNPNISDQFSLYKVYDGANGTNGTNGRDGTDGRGIVSTQISYQVGTSGTVAPTGTWRTTVPETVSGQYLWTRTYTTYSDNTYTTQYSVSYHGDTGVKGDKGDKGEDGVSVTIYSERVEYKEGTSGTVAPSGTWSTTIPSVTAGNYLWTRTVVVYSDGTATTAYSVARQGVNGTNGTDGTPGRDGVDGVSNYVHIKYSEYASPTDAQMTETPSKYIGICVNTSVSDPTTARSYAWTQFEGDTGAQGVPGMNGADGSPAYVHFAYALNSTGSEGFSLSYFDGAKYIGVYSDNIEIDSEDYRDYVWSLIKGDKGDTGVGVSGITEYYAINNSSQTAPADSQFSTNVQTMTAVSRYLWNYEIVSYTDSTHSRSPKHVIGVYGQNGDNGVSISGVVNYYLASSAASGITRDTSGWTTTVQAVTPNLKYLWNYEKVNYSSGSPTYTDPCIIGAYGDTGAKGDKGDKGLDGSDGENGYTAFLTNENITFSGDKDGKVAAISVSCNVVCYDGTTKVTPTVGTVTGMPNGMAVTKGVAVNNEIPITIRVDNNATLGGAGQQFGVLYVPITNPVSTTLAITWSKVNTGATGANGESAVLFKLYASNGYMFVNQEGTLQINAFAAIGGEQITTGATYIWKKYISGNWVTIIGETGNYLNVSGSSVDGIGNYRCEMTYNDIVYSDTFTLIDKTDNYQGVIESSGGSVFKNSVGSSVLRCRLFQTGSEIDSAGTEYVYTWYKLDENGESVDWIEGSHTRTGKSITVSSDDVENKATFICDVTDATQAPENQLKTTAQFSIVDLNDPVQSGTAPLNPVTDMLWIDTSASPNELKRWDGTAWVSVSNVDVPALENRITTIETEISEQEGTIQLLATKEEVSEIDGRVTSNETEIAAINVRYDDISLVVAQKATNYRQATAPANPTAGDIWVQPIITGEYAGTEKVYQALGAVGRKAPIFAYDDDGNLLYTYSDDTPEGERSEIRVDDDGDLQIKAEGTYSIVDDEFVGNAAWKEVQGESLARLSVTVDGISTYVENLDGDVTSLQQNADAIYAVARDTEGNISGVSLTPEALSAIADDINLEANNSITLLTKSVNDFGEVVQVDSDGLHVYGYILDENENRVMTGGEVLIDSTGLSVNVAGNSYSKFSGNYAQFGDYQIRKTNGGGLVFKKANIVSS